MMAGTHRVCNAIPPVYNNHARAVTDGVHRPLPDPLMTGQVTAHTISAISRRQHATLHACRRATRNSDARGSQSTSTFFHRYRKHFALPAEWKGTTVEVYIEGSFHRTQVWLNGVPLGLHKAGCVCICVLVSSVSSRTAR